MMRGFKARSIHKAEWKICLLVKQASSQRCGPERAKCEFMLSAIRL